MPQLLPPSSTPFSLTTLRPPIALLAIIGCIVWAFSELLFRETSRYAEGLVLFLTLIALARGSRDRQLFVPFLFLLAAIALEVASWITSFQGVDFKFHPSQAPHIDRIGKWFLFIFFAFWLPKRPWAVTMFWAAAVFAFLLTPWISGGGFNELLFALQGHRVDAGTLNAQHAAMLAGLILIGAFCLLLHSTANPGKPKRFLLAGLALALVSMFFLYATQTRGVWLGTLIAVIFILSIHIFARRAAQKAATKSKGIVFLILVLMIIGTWFATNSSLSSRVDQESSSASLALQGRFAELPMDSTGIRLRSWYYALPWIGQSPWFGWGADGSKLIMQESDALPAELKARFGHLHSTYLDILAQYGLAGLILYLTLLGWFLRRLISAYRNEALPFAAFLFGVGFLAYWLIVNIFESYLLFSSGRYAFTIVLAGTLSLIHRSELSSEQVASTLTKNTKAQGNKNVLSGSGERPHSHSALL